MDAADSKQLSIGFIVGSVAFSLPKDECSEDKTHRWSVYIRGLEDEDLSYLIHRVVFVLHPSFPNSSRTITTPPYEVTEFGWGEFDVIVRVHFKAGNADRSVSMNHFIRLFGPPGQPINKAVVSEKYDEFVFVDPPDNLRRAILSGPTAQYAHPQLKHHWNLHSHVQDEESQLEVLYQTYQSVMQNMFELKCTYDTFVMHIEQINRKIRLHNAREYEQRDPSTSFSTSHSTSVIQDASSPTDTVKPETQSDP